MPTGCDDRLDARVHRRNRNGHAGDGLPRHRLIPRLVLCPKRHVRGRPKPVRVARDGDTGPRLRGCNRLAIAARLAIGPLLELANRHAAQERVRANDRVARDRTDRRRRIGLINAHRARIPEEVSGIERAVRHGDARALQLLRVLLREGADRTFVLGRIEPPILGQVQIGAATAQCVPRRGDELITPGRGRARVARTIVAAAFRRTDRLVIAFGNGAARRAAGRSHTKARPVRRANHLNRHTLAGELQVGLRKVRLRLKP